MKKCWVLITAALFILIPYSAFAESAPVPDTELEDYDTDYYPEINARPPGIPCQVMALGVRNGRAVIRLQTVRGTRRIFPFFPAPPDVNLIMELAEFAMSEDKLVMVRPWGGSNQKFMVTSQAIR